MSPYNILRQIYPPILILYSSSAKQSRIDSFLKLVTPFGILESARTGLMALPRSPMHGTSEEALIKDADEVVDASQLPPG